MRTFVYLSILTGMFLSIATAQIPGYNEAGQWPYGEPLTIEKYSDGVNNLLFYNEGTVLHTASLSNNGDVTLLSSFRTNYLVHNIAISPDGQKLAVSDKWRWITIFDMTDPAAPIMLGRFDFDNPSLPVELQGGSPEGMDFVDNNTLISAVTPKGLYAFDITDPSNITVSGYYFEVGINSVEDVAIQDGFAFVADKENGLSVFDISDLTDITLVLRDINYAAATDIQIIDNQAYIARGLEGLSIASINTNPLSVTETAHVDVSTSVKRVLPLPDNHVAIADEWNGQGVLVVDINNPTQPIIIDNSGTTSPKLVVKDHLIVAIDGGSFNGNDKNKLIVYDTENMGSVGTLQELNFSQLYASTVDVSLFESTLALLLQDGGTVVVDTSNPTRPETALWMHKEQVIRAVATTGNYLVAADEYLNLFINDISDINNPVTIPTYDIGFRFPTHVIAVDANQVIVAYGDEIDWLSIDAFGATLEGHWSGNSLQRVAKDNEIVVATGSTQLTILDFTQVSSPVMLAQHTTSHIVSDVDISGNYVYLSLGTGGFEIWDISDPVNPVVVSTTELPLAAVSGIEAHEQTVYIATGVTNGVISYDISNPASPQLINIIRTPGEAAKVTVNNDHMVIADTNAGAVIFSNIVESPIFKNGFEQL
ncbi:MAG: hypothetical protein KDI92_11355 [Xanthomonadales bacterium]|nr:hypothetical protein [Xanthomonadales bacterium]